MASTDTACWRNNANTADICISKNAGDALVLGGAGGIVSSGPVSAGANSISGGALSASSLTINGDTAQTNGPHFAIMFGFQPGNMFQATLGFQVLAKPVTIESIQVESTTQAITCSTAPVVRVRDGISSTIGPSISLTSGTNFWSLTGQSVSYPAGITLFLEVSNPGVCSTPAQNLSVNVSGRMQ